MRRPAAVRRALATAGLVAAAAAALGCHGDHPATGAAAGGSAAGTAAPAAPPPDAAPAGPIAACQRYAEALRARTDDLDVDPAVRRLLASQGQLLAAATRDPSPAVRDELTLRCADGLVALTRLAGDADPYGTFGGGGVVGGVVGGLAGAPPSPPPPPPAGGARPSTCRRLADVFDRLGRCTSIPAPTRDSIAQARSLILDNYAQLSPDLQRSMDDSCKTAADAYAQMLDAYRCP